MKTISCSRRPLAGSDQCAIEECSCGSIHVTIGGAITLRLQPGTVAEIATTLNEAMQRWAMAKLGQHPDGMGKVHAKAASS